MPGVAVVDSLALRVEHGEERRDETTRVDAAVEESIHVPERCPGLGAAVELGEQRCAEGGHQQRGRHPLARDVGDHESHPPVGQDDVVVVVPAHFACRLAEARDLGSPHLRRPLR